MARGGEFEWLGYFKWELSGLHGIVICNWNENYDCDMEHTDFACWNQAGEKFVVPRLGMQDPGV
jgi:hypothetical protein